MKELLLVHEKGIIIVCLFVVCLFVFCFSKMTQVDLYNYSFIIVYSDTQFRNMYMYTYQVLMTNNAVTYCTVYVEGVMLLLWSSYVVTPGYQHG